MDTFNLNNLAKFAQAHNTGGGIWGLDSYEMDTQEGFLAEILDFSRVWVYHCIILDEDTLELSLGVYEYNSDRWRILDIRCKVSHCYPNIYMAINRECNYTLDIYMPSKGSPFDDYYGAVVLTVGVDYRQVHCYIECLDINIYETNDDFGNEFM